MLASALAIGGIWLLGRGAEVPERDREHPELPVEPGRTPRKAPAQSPDLPAAVSEKAAKLAQSWQRALAAPDPARKRAALDSVLGGLEAGDPETALAAMHSLYAGLRAQEALGEDVEALRAKLRPAVLRRLDSPHSEVRAAALSALQAVGVGPGDSDRLLGLARDPSPLVRARAAGAIRLIFPPRPSAAAARTALGLVNDSDPRVVRAALAAFGGASLGPEWEARILELSGDPRYALDAIRSGLGPMPDKSDAALGLLLRAAAGTSPALRSAALGALGQGVPIDRRPKVAAEALRLAALRRLGERPDLTPGSRKELARTLAAIERRQ